MIFNIEIFDNYFDALNEFENYQPPTCLPTKQVIKTLIGDIIDIKEALENAHKNTYGTNLLNKIKTILLSLLTSMHETIGDQHLLLRLQVLLDSKREFQNQRGDQHYLLTK